jgi:transglutaminase-like putative cysteine protease
MPAEMYLRESPLAHINGALRAFTIDSTAGAEDPLDAMHRLMSEVHLVMSFDPYQTDDPDSAAEAFALRRGRARDFAHIFIACARFRDVPARFVNGYRAAEEAGGEAGAHCWAEAHVPTLGWVAFDPTTCICADTHYVRVAVGFDARDGSFFRAANGMGGDAVESVIRVDQAGYQTQA